MNKPNTISRLGAFLGIGAYFLIAAALFGLDPSAILNKTQLLSVTVGIALLTLSQYQRGQTLEKIGALAKQNAILAGGITTLFALMNALNQPTIGNRNIAQALLPLLYGALWYALLSTNQNQNQNQNQNFNPNPASSAPPEPQSPLNQLEIAYPLLTERGFTPREIHVALRLLTNTTNKEIAEDLFISEATVKKHIQNLFRKCGASDRQDFLKIYTAWLNDYHETRRRP